MHAYDGRGYILFQIHRNQFIFAFSNHFPFPPYKDSKSNIYTGMYESHINRANAFGKEHFNKYIYKQQTYH